MSGPERRFAGDVCVSRRAACSAFLLHPGAIVQILLGQARSAHDAVCVPNAHIGNKGWIPTSGPVSWLVSVGGSG